MRACRRAVFEDGTGGLAPYDASPCVDNDGAVGVGPALRLGTLAMGVNNRQRRRAKQLRRRKVKDVRDAPRRSPLGGSGRSGQTGRLDDQAVRGAVLAAAEACLFEPQAAYQDRLQFLAGVEGRVGHAAVDAAVTWWIERALDRAWDSGWQPADVVGALRRTLSARHAQTVAPAVAASGGRRPEAAADGRWAGQVATIGQDVHPSPEGRPRTSVIALGVEAVSLLLHLPPLPRLSATDGAGRRAGRGGSGAMLERVRALLAKAESTTSRRRRRPSPPRRRS
jgi:hypothetical protein